MMHHAILVRYSKPELFPVNTLSTETVVDQSFEKLMIDDVRSLSESAHRRPSEGSSGTCFVVRTSFITVEAQHALLKLLEEPPLTSRFVFIIPPSVQLLGTVLSRVHIEVSEADTEIADEFVEFMKMSLKERFETIESKLKEKDIAWQEAIRRGLITYVGTIAQKNATILIDLEFVVANLLTSGASNKMLLDQLALSLPRK